MQKNEEWYGHKLSLMQIIIVQLPDKTRRTREQILKRKKERNKKEIVHHPAQIYDN
jgi:hypothetical protein